MRLGKIVRQKRTRTVLRGRRTALGQRQLWAEVETFCLFVGHGRNGSTLLGALLDAHPDALVAHETDILAYIDLEVPRSTLYGILFERARWFTEDKGLQWQGYDYRVPGQWQGRYRQLRLIGDKKARRTTHHLGADPSLLDRLERTVGVPVKIVNTVRNPFDNVSTIMRRAARIGRGRPLAVEIDEYLERVGIIDNLRRHLGEQVLDVHHEQVVADPDGELARLARFVGLDEDPAWLEAASSLIFPSPKRTREGFDWPADQTDRLCDAIDRHDFLHRYRDEVLGQAEAGR